MKHIEIRYKKTFNIVQEIEVDDDYSDKDIADTIRSTDFGTVVNDPYIEVYDDNDPNSIGSLRIVELK